MPVEKAWSYSKCFYEKGHYYCTHLHARTQVKEVKEHLHNLTRDQPTDSPGSRSQSPLGRGTALQPQAGAPFGANRGDSLILHSGHGGLRKLTCSPAGNERPHSIFQSSNSEDRKGFEVSGEDGRKRYSKTRTADLFKVWSHFHLQNRPRNELMYPPRRSLVSKEGAFVSPVSPWAARALSWGKCTLIQCFPRTTWQIVSPFHRGRSPDPAIPPLEKTQTQGCS